jgi:hypothetical protein
MSFMQKQITDKQRWLQVETTIGTEWLPVNLVGDLPGSQFLDHEVQDTDCADIQAYCEGTIESWENIEGYGARLSAPGYLDCTEWTVFDSVEKAETYLEEMYGEGDEDSELSAD